MNARFCFTSRRRLLQLCLPWLAVLFVSSGSAAQAQEIRAVANFSPSTINIGETSTILLQVVGSRRTGTPPRIQIEGLDIVPAGSTSANQIMVTANGINNVVMVNYAYQVTPQRTGTFLLPALEFRVEGQVVRTQPVSLRVQEPGTPAPTVDARGKPSIVLGKTFAYVGEAVPLELQLTMDNEIQWEIEMPPSLDGEGFSKQKLSDQQTDTFTRDGRIYDLGTFKTAITPGRAGKLKIGPAEFAYVAAVPIPRAQRNRPRAMGDDPLEQIFGNMMGSSYIRRAFKATAPAVELEVKPLPLTGQPKSFSGAVGQFKLTSSASATKVKVGDPITLKISLAGSGDFDRVEAPVLTETAGWRSYPPAPGDKHVDQTGIRGYKTFEVAVIPETNKTALPVFEFSYFDPATAKYVTLQTKADPITVDGAPLLPPQTSPEMAARNHPGATPAPTAPPVPAATDILGLRYDRGPVRAAQPLYRQPIFWFAQGVPLLALVGWCLAHFWKPKSALQKDQAQWRRQRSDLAAQLRRERSPEPFFAAASHVLQFDAAARSGMTPEALDAPTVNRVLALPAEDAALVSEIFETRAQAMFAGAGAAGSGTSALPEEQRERILALVAKTARIV